MPHAPSPTDDAGTDTETTPDYPIDDRPTTDGTTTRDADAPSRVTVRAASARADDHQLTLPAACTEGSHARAE